MTTNIYELTGSYKDTSPVELKGKVFITDGTDLECIIEEESIVNGVVNKREYHGEGLLHIFRGDMIIEITQYPRKKGRINTSIMVGKKSLDGIGGEYSGNILNTLIETYKPVETKKVAITKEFIREIQDESKNPFGDIKDLKIELKYIGEEEPKQN